MSALPTASVIPSATQETSMTMEQVLSNVKHFSLAELIRVQRHLSQIQRLISEETEKKFKVFQKETTKSSGKKVKKAGSMPKGILPPQFRKPNAWKKFVLEHARANGWPEFTMNHTYKDKETGEKKSDILTMSASVENNGVYQFPEGRVFSEKDAMSLSKFYWDSKQSVGTQEELYRQFEATYSEESILHPTASSSVSSSSSSSASSTVTPSTTPATSPQLGSKRIIRKAT